jgi:hypothetical protein
MWKWAIDIDLSNIIKHYLSMNMILRMWMNFSLKDLGKNSNIGLLSTYP